ncbi:MAG: bifunctional (p)ppGpp synthetase/guanosine-3',5'-bis(diphosphate) 3'-pyrophosphohydrolase [Anaerolineaceae bacterium]
MDLDQLISKLPASYSPEDRGLVVQAARLAEKAHTGQTRANGQPYFSHCLSVAMILAEIQSAPTLVIAGLLHDVVIDGNVTIEIIRIQFGETVAAFVEDLTRITGLPKLNRADQHEDERKPLPPSVEDVSDSRRADAVVETLRKMLLAIGDDVRVVIIKLADRLHNMRTLGSLPLDRQKKIAQETLDIFAPLANRLGIWQMKWELEDLGFQYTMPDKYKEISDQVALRRSKRQDEVKNIVTQLEKIIKAAEVKATVNGRPKHIYSIYRKMERKGQNFDAIRDLRAVRVIVNDVESCYKVLGLIHMRYKPIPGEFDDYIAAKKPNNYQSLHTSVIYTDGKPLEIQIRTWEMHQNAEYGVAAHWRYKEQDAKMSSEYEQKLTTMRGLLAWNQDVEDSQEILDSMRSDLFKDRVYIMTPKGDVIELPKDATPIDFAYAVHTDIGHRCRGAKVNGKLVTLDHALHTGDQVEILTTNRGGPSRDWLNPNLGMIKSTKSRSKIRQWFKQQDREQNLINGKEALEREFKRLGVTQYDLNDFVSVFNVRSVEDLYVGIGSGDIPIGRLVNRVSEIQKEALAEEIPLVTSTPSVTHPGSSVMVMGLSGLATNIARCCNPMIGDEIVGYITRGRGATIHRSDCPNIMRVKDKERLINVTWGKTERTFPVPIQINAYNRQGLMSDISTVISGEPVRLVDLSMTTRQHMVTINLVVEVEGINQLSRLLARLENLNNVIEAIRTKPG